VIYLWKKANINGIENHFADKLDTFNITKFTEINSMWIHVKDLILCAIKEHVPAKRTLEKHTHPWTNTYLGRLSNRKQKAYTRARRGKNKTDQKR
jgi:hypothetical protein